VVADEVRKLAERTASATVEIAQMINSVMSQTEVAIGHTSKTNERVATGVAMSREAADKVGDQGQHAGYRQPHVGNHQLHQGAEHGNHRDGAKCGTHQCQGAGK
jgi:hypothetical protein